MNSVEREREREMVKSCSEEDSNLEKEQKMRERLSKIQSYKEKINNDKGGIYIFSNNEIYQQSKNDTPSTLADWLCK